MDSGQRVLNACPLKHVKGRSEGKTATTSVLTPFLGIPEGPGSFSPPCTVRSWEGPRSAEAKGLAQGHSESEDKRQGC